MLFFLHKLIDDDCMMYSDSKLVVVDDIAKLWNTRARACVQRRKTRKKEIGGGLGGQQVTGAPMHY